jgi:hypothetical protein
MIIPIQSNELVIHDPSTEILVSFTHAHEVDLVAMKDRHDLQMVVGALIYQALVTIAEVYQRLATHLDLRKLVA